MNRGLDDVARQFDLLKNQVRGLLFDQMMNFCCDQRHQIAKVSRTLRQGYGLLERD
jgi:hypothetical protein